MLFNDCVFIIVSYFLLRDLQILISSCYKQLLRPKADGKKSIPEPFYALLNFQNILKGLFLQAKLFNLIHVLDHICIWFYRHSHISIYTQFVIRSASEYSAFVAYQRKTAGCKESGERKIGMSKMMGCFYLFLLLNH